MMCWMGFSISCVARRQSSGGDESLLVRDPLLEWKRTSVVSLLSTTLVAREYKYHH